MTPLGREGRDAAAARSLAQLSKAARECHTLVTITCTHTIKVKPRAASCWKAATSRQGRLHQILLMLAQQDGVWDELDGSAGPGQCARGRA